MPLTNYTTRQIDFKIVFYGTEFAGKTTSLRAIHSKVDAISRSDLAGRNTGADKTLFFDFVLGGVSLLEGFKTRIEVYTVPGHVVYNAPRQLVLRDADGVIFVVDSQWERMEENVKSFQNLQDNLKKAGADLDSIPFVVQYNKRDLPEIAPVAYLDFVFNNRKTPAPVFETVATSGENVIGALNAVCERALSQFAERIRDHSAPGLTVS